MRRNLLLLVIAILFVGGCEPPPPPKSATTISLRLLHTVELAPYVDSILEEFHTIKPTIGDGIGVTIEPVRVSIIDGALDIARGFTKGHLWLAPSSSLIAYANIHRRNLGPLHRDCQQLFASPMVFAAQKSNLEALGATGQSLSFGRLWNLESGLAAKPANIALSHAAPASSDSGIPALEQLAYLSRGGSGVLTPEEIGTPEFLQKLKAFESVASMYSPREWMMLSRASSRQSGIIQLSLTTEQRLASYNAFLEEKPGSLIALYPSEGSVWQSYSLCTPEADWVTPAHRAAIKTVQEFMAGAFAQGAAKRRGYRTTALTLPDMSPLLPEFGINLQEPTTSLVPLPGEGLAKLLSLWPAVLRPHAVMFVLDTSGSMEGDALRKSQEQFRNFVARMAPLDFKGLVTFSSKPELSQPLTKDSIAFTDAVNRPIAKGGSALYDALLLAMQQLVTPEVNNFRKTVILVTDGDDKSSQLTLENLKDEMSQILTGHDITVVVVSLAGGDSTLTDLSSIAKHAHGLFREGKVADIPSMMSEVAYLL